MRISAAVTAALIAFAVGMVPAEAQWSGEYWFSRLDVKTAWQISKGANVVVAVVDAGVVDTLGDLKGQVLPGYNALGTSGDGRNDKGERCDEFSGCFSHGTQMALDIAGSGKGKGFQGVAPAAKILPIKVSDHTGDGASPEKVAAGIRWAVDHGAKIINLSFGDDRSCDPTEGDAIKYAYQHDVIVVAASGNDGTAVSSPANCPGALAIGGIDANFKPWSGSSSGPEVDFVGAAAGIVSETLDGTELTNSNGTSDATAIVAGTFALIRSHFPTMSARDVVTRALYNVHNGPATDFGQRIDDKLGYGEILPWHAMHDALPAGPSNPIYDAWATKLGPPTPTTSSTPASTPPVTSPGGSQTSPTPAGITAARSHNADSGGTSTGAVIGIVAGVIVVAAIAGGLFLRSRGRRAPRAVGGGR
jgi:hypothetical protein